MGIRVGPTSSTQSSFLKRVNLFSSDAAIVDGTLNYHVLQ